MKKLILFCMLAAVVMAAVSCGPKSAQDKKGADNLPDSAALFANSAELISPQSCDSLSADKFCVKGFSFIKMGDELTWADLKVEGATVKDTVFEETTNAGEFAWNVKKVSFPDGDLLLEADFDENKFLNRARIETSHFRTRHGIGVGSTVGEIANTYSLITVRPFSEMKLVELVAAGPGGTIVFHVSDPELKLQQAKLLKELPAEAKVMRVVLMR